MTLGGLLEFFLGNTFAFVVFCSFGKPSFVPCTLCLILTLLQGGFWFTLGSTLTPAFNAYGAYASDPLKPHEGLASAGFHASYGSSNGTSLASWKAADPKSAIRILLALYGLALPAVLDLCVAH